MKSNEIIIGFIGDNYVRYSDFWKNKYKHLTIESQILYDTFHTELIYNIFDEIKMYIRNNINNLDLSMFDYNTLNYLIPDKETLINTVLCKMAVSDEIINNIMLQIKNKCKK